MTAGEPMEEPATFKTIIMYILIFQIPMISPNPAHPGEEERLMMAVDSGNSKIMTFPEEKHVLEEFNNIRAEWRAKGLNVSAATMWCRPIAVEIGKEVGIVFRYVSNKRTMPILGPTLYGWKGIGVSSDILTDRDIIQMKIH